MSMVGVWLPCLVMGTSMCVASMFGQCGFMWVWLLCLGSGEFYGCGFYTCAVGASMDVAYVFREWGLLTIFIWTMETSKDVASLFGLCELLT